MGQIASTTGQDAGSDKERETDLEMFSKDHVTDLFINKCLQVFTKAEINLILAKLNIRNIHEKQVLALSDFNYLLLLEGVLEEDELTSNEEFKKACRHLYESFKVVGSFPFIHDYLYNEEGGLTVNELLVASLLYTGRERLFLGEDVDKIKLIFVSLCLPQMRDGDLHDTVKKETKWAHESEKVPGGYAESYVLEVYKTQSSIEDSKDMALHVKWDTFKSKDFEGTLDTANLRLKASDLLLIIALALMATLVGKDHPDLFRSHLSRNVLDGKNWHSYKVYAMSIVKFIKTDLNEKNIEASYISLEEFRQAFTSGYPSLFPSFFGRVLIDGLLSPLALRGSAKKSGSQNKQTGESSIAKNDVGITFKESRLVNEAFLSLTASIISSSGSDIVLNSKNMVMLYSGADQGFSIRSLESKILKWRAPSLFIVAGKRLRAKTMASNKRYQQFDSEYPRIFRSSDNSRKDWQSENDRITYAVLVNPPWRTSNKKNFGDEKCMILSVLPRADYHKSFHNPLLNGESVYFNNLGMGVGFGNGQPLNKNGVKRYQPGDISLTVESNLEFAVFRHMANLSSNAPKYFAKSSQVQLQEEDFEDRFIITDLEVWGIGSTKELDEQRKQWEWEKKQAEARQNVNFKNLGEERAFLEMVGLAGNHNSSGGSV